MKVTDIEMPTDREFLDWCHLWHVVQWIQVASPHSFHLP